MFKALFGEETLVNAYKFHYFFNDDVNDADGRRQVKIPTISDLIKELKRTHQNKNHVTNYEITEERLAIAALEGKDSIQARQRGRPKKRAEPVGPVNLVTLQIDPKYSVKVTRGENFLDVTTARRSKEIERRLSKVCFV